MTHTGIFEINATCSDIAFNSCSSELYIDNKFFGYTPIQLFIPEGNHNYKLVKDGYIPQPSTGITDIKYGSIDIKYGIKSSLDIKLTNDKKTGALSINSTPEGAHIFIDNIEQKAIAPTMISDLTPGDHEYKLTLPGYIDIKGKFTMTLGQSTIVEEAMVQSEEFGTIYIYSKSILHGLKPYILEGATIYIDNVDSGKKVPMPITGLTKGIHTFRVSMPGIEDANGMFIINGKDVLLIGISSILLPNTGIVTIRTHPIIGNIKNAKVYIDDKDTGKYTTTRLALYAGTYRYKLTLSEYEDIEGKFDILPYGTTQVSAYPIHVHASSLGTINVSSNPIDTYINIDNVDIGEYTPATVRNLSDGDYTYKLSKPGYSDSIGTFTILNGNTIDINPTLTQSDTILEITSNIISTHISIDGHDEGLTTPTEITGLSPGVHTYGLFIPDVHGGAFETVEGTFNIEKNKITKVHGNLYPKKDHNKGNLTINSIPTGAHVFIDDIESFVTPYNTTEISPGIHKIKLSYPGYKDWIGTVYVNISNIVSITEQLKPLSEILTSD
jgi:hypothetical protein